MAVLYVDNAAVGSNDGTSWTDAWTDPNSAGAAQPGDTVYISGGPSGSSKTYNMGGTFSEWTLASGTAENIIAYKIGQDTAHNGVAIFNSLNGFKWIFGAQNIVVSGDAGDGRQHFRLTNYLQCYISNAMTCSNLRISYVYQDDVGGSFIDINSTTPADGIEIDHCYVKIAAPGADHASTCVFGGGGYDLNSVHDCTILIPYDDVHLDGFGADCFQWEGGGFSIYNNVIRGYGAGATARGNHQDGVQTLGPGAYIKIYGNIFIDIQNYCVFLEAISGGFSHIRVYNNLCLRTTPSDTPALVCGTSGGFVGVPPCVMSDIIFANNMMCNYGPGGSGTGGEVALNNLTSTTTNFIDCYVVNNLFVDSAGTVDVAGNLTSTVSHNVSVLDANAPLSFMDYTQYNIHNNYHIISTASSIIGLGFDGSSWFTADIDGVTRPTPWDVGAYAYILARYAGTPGTSAMLACF